MANSEWLDGMLNPQIKKEAMESQGTDKQDHFERKVVAHDWIKGVSEQTQLQLKQNIKLNLLLRPCI